MAGIFGTTPGTLVGPLSQNLLDLIQTGFLERYLEIGLNSVLGYNRLSLREIVPSGIGETLTKSKFGRKPPVSRPINPSFMSSMDSGMTPSGYPSEQYTFTMGLYGDTSDVNLLQAEVMIADQLKTFSFNNGVQAAQSLDRIAKWKLFSRYAAGNTFVTKAGTTTTAHVDDIRGFQTVWVNGRETSVSSSATLNAIEINASTGATVQTLTITAAAADAVNTSIFPTSDGANSDGISGTLTFNAATAPSAGNAIVATNAATVIRPNARVATTSLQEADILGIGTIFDAVTQLRNNAVPAHEGSGQYECTVSNTSLRQLFADQDFKVLYAGRDQTNAFRQFDVVSMFGVTFVPTTESYVQSGGQTEDSVTLTPQVQRAFVSGQGVLLRGDFEGLETFINKQGVSPLGDMMLVDGIAQILRPPLDRMGTAVSLTWYWVGDFSAPTDITATPSIIPTATSSNWKRGVVIEHTSS